MTAATLTSDRLSWDDLVALEPRLQTLLDDLVETLHHTDQPPGLRQMDLYRREGDRPSYRARMDTLVGWDAKHPDCRVRTSEARKVVYDKLVDTVQLFESATDPYEQWCQ